MTALDILGILTSTVVVISVIDLALWAYAGMLAWIGDRRQPMIVAIVFTILAFVVSDIVVLVAYLLQPDDVIVRFLVGVALGLQTVAAISTIVVLRARR
jgi:hypothetical protein